MPLFEVGRTHLFLSSTLEALWCAHNIHGISDPRRMGSTLQAKLDILEDSLNKFMTLSVVMNKLQTGLGRHLLYWMSLFKPQCNLLKVSPKPCFPRAVLVTLHHPAVSGLCSLIANRASSSIRFPAPASSASSRGRSTGLMSDGNPLGWAFLGSWLGSLVLKLCYWYVSVSCASR